MKLTVKPTIAVVSTFAVVFVLGFFVLIAPELTPIGQDLARLNQYTLTSGSLKVKKDASALTKYQSQSDLANALLPAENQLYDLSVQIEALAKTKSVGLTGLTLNPAVATGTTQTTSSQAASGTTPLPAGVQKASIVTSVTGEYAQVQGFVEGLTSLKRYIQIQDITVSKGVSGKVIAQITASTYYLPYGGAKK
jgi:Tfp pilus assembly protein PilO